MKTINLCDSCNNRADVLSCGIYDSYCKILSNHNMRDNVEECSEYKQRSNRGKTK